MIAHSVFHRAVAVVTPLPHHVYLAYSFISTESLCKTPHTSSGVNLQFESDTSITTSLYRDPSLSSHLSPHTSLTSSESWDGHVWRPLLLMVPLRLGLSCINDIYMRSLKVNKLNTQIRLFRELHAFYWQFYISMKLFEILIQLMHLFLIWL